jgi:translation initiation factor 2 beta subunit (eIF-2beta)/eIF-5
MFNFSKEEKFYLATKESSLNDPLYRYQICKPIINVTGKTGNKSTWFENSEQFSKAIGRPSDFFAKYISNKLSCPSKFDKDKNCQYFKGDYSYDTIILYLEILKKEMIINYQVMMKRATR